MSEIISLYPEPTPEHFYQLYQWIETQGSTRLRVLAKIEEISTYYLGEEQTWHPARPGEPGVVMLGGYEITTRLWVELITGNTHFRTYDSVAKKSDCDALLEQLKPGSIWLVEGELALSPGVLPRLMGARFHAIPERLRVCARHVLKR